MSKNIINCCSQVPVQTKRIVSIYDNKNGGINFFARLAFLDKIVKSCMFFYGCRLNMFNYKEEDMKNALQAMADGMKCGKAARTFKVPRTTLRYKYTGKYPKERKMGPITVLAPHQEKLLCDWIIHMESHGFPITKCQLLDSVQKLLNDEKRKTVFPNNRPERGWFQKFKKRNPNVVECSIWTKPHFY